MKINDKNNKKENTTKKTKQVATPPRQSAPPPPPPGTAAAAAAAAARPTASSLPNAVTPEKSSAAKKKRKTNSTDQRNVRVKQEPNPVVLAAAARAAGSTVELRNITNPRDNQIYLDEFEHWLRDIHVGPSGKPLSESNARSVKNRVKDLITGKGIGYKNWPGHVIFNRGRIVTLDTDLEQLLKTAKQYEDDYGRDLGNGWLMKHPIKKLILYKKFIVGRRPIDLTNDDD